MPFERMSEELKRILERHSVAGYRVDVPALGLSTIIRQAPSALGMVDFLVRPDRKIHFDDFARTLGVRDNPMTLQEWRDKFSGRTPLIPQTLWETLEAGGLASEKDAFFEEMVGRGCLDADQIVTCYLFDITNAVIPPGLLEVGMLVDYAEGRGEGYGGTLGWAGRIAGFGDKKDIVLLEVFAPTPFMRTPDSIVPDKIRDGFFSSKVAFMGYGLVQAFEDQGRELPEGKWAEDEREWVLEEPLELSDIEEFCKKNYPDDGHCIYHAMLLYIIPIRIGMGKFHPLLEKLVPPEIVVEYE